MLVYTSRTLKGGGLETAREVSAAVTEVVQAALGAASGLGDRQRRHHVA